MHPYEMQQLMRERRVDVRVKLKAGSLYHTVERLEANGHIEVVETQRDGRRPERTVYGLTESGRDAFTERARTMLSTPAEEYPEYPVALSAANDLEQDTVIEDLNMRVLRLESSLAAQKVVLDRLAESDLPKLYWIEHEYIYRQRKSELDWTNGLIADVESGRICWPSPNNAPLVLVENEEASA